MKRSTRFLGSVSAFLLVLPGITSPTFAQTPSPILPIPPTPLPTQLPAPPPPLQIPAPPPSVPPSPSIPGTIRVDRFEFVGNTAFSDRELAETLGGFTNREITFAELLQVEAAITQKYVAAGFVNSGAVIPAEQTFDRSRAVVRVQIVEGGLEAIEISGTRRLAPGYIRSRLELATRAPLNRDRLLEALQLLQLNPLIETISAELQSGSRPDRSLLAIRVQETDSFSGNLFTDNGRSPSIGQWRRGASLTQANLLGRGDALQLAYTNTEGSNAGDFSYSLPLNSRNGSLQITANFADTAVIEPPFDRINIRGNSRRYELTYRQPLLQTPTQELALGVTASRLESDTSLQNQPFPLSPGADDRGRTRISALRFSQEFTQRNARSVIALRSQFSLGLDWFDATVNQNAPDSRFFAWRGQAQYVRLLAPDTLLLLRSDVQLSPDSLVPLEQFSLGGAGSGRGYRPDLLLSDDGIFTSAELRVPILRVPDVKGILQVTPFVDFGVGWNQPNADSSTALLSVGAGLLWQMGDRFSARLDYGFPLTNGDRNDTTGEDRFSFSVNCSLF